MINIVIVIPTFEPTQLLLNTLEDLDSYPEIKRLPKIIVNDGPRNNCIVQKISSDDRVTIIDHGKNKGKGAALKTAIRHVLHSGSLKNSFILTVDSDGQHRGSDVQLLIDSIRKHGEGFHIGCRQLGKKETPFRSFLGNSFSRTLLRWVHSYELPDTQSGLRAYPPGCFESLLSLESDRYEFEMEAIIMLVRKKNKFYQVPVATVYLDRNRLSHFRPLKDSILVIWVMLFFRNKD